MSDQSMDALTRSLAEKKSHLTKIVVRLGPNATAKEIRDIAFSERLGSVDARMLNEIRNFVHPHRKREEKKPRYKIVEVSSGQEPSCPYCGGANSRVGQLHLQEDGKAKRTRNCLTCKKRFTSLEPNENADRSLTEMQKKRSESSRRLSSLLTEKQCTKCGWILPVELFRKKDRDYYASWCRECQNGKRSETQLKNNLDKYGLTIEEYQSLIESQKGGCAICGNCNSHSHGKVRSPLVFDHDHKNGAFRGLICNNCNRAIGLFGDDSGALERAITYLHKFESKENTNGC